MLLGASLGAGCGSMICCWGAASEVDSGIFKSSSWGRVEFCMAGSSVSVESGSSLEC